MMSPRSTALTPRETPNWSRLAHGRGGASTPLSLAHLTVLDASPPMLIDLADASGCAFVGLRLVPVTTAEQPWPLATDKALRDETKARLSATGVGVLDVELVKLTPDFDAAAFEAILDVAADLGARRVLTQVHDHNLARAAANFWNLCEQAKARDLTCDIEFLTWTGIRDIKTASAFIAGVNHSHAGLCIDTLHFARSGCTPAEIDNIPAHWLNFVQICDAPAAAPSTQDGLIEAAREGRLWPGEGGLPLVDILSRLSPQTPLALEIPNRELARLLSPEARVRGAMAATLRVLERVEERRAIAG